MPTPTNILGASIDDLLGMSIDQLLALPLDPPTPFVPPATVYFDLSGAPPGYVLPPFAVSWLNQTGG